MIQYYPIRDITSHLYPDSLIFQAAHIAVKYQLRREVGEKGVRGSRGVDVPIE